jgi:DNA-binding response OmpR family regulator
MAKILVVDDERMICDLLRNVLARHGHEVMVAMDGREAVALFREHRPGITLLDLHMPEMDGIAVLKQIRNVDPMAAVMMLTGGGTEALEQQARALGVTDFLKKGHSLTVLVDAMERALQQSSQPVAAARSGDLQAPSGGSQTPLVLVVDDEEMIRSLLTKFLTLRGYRVRTAQNGMEALAQVGQETPHIVILDMYMPGMNGVEVLRQLRAKQYAGGVVALTASQDEKLLQQTLELGSVDVIGKPVDLERLELVIQVGLALTGR